MLSNQITPRRQLSPRQTRIIKDIRSAILDIVAESGRKPGSVVHMLSLYQSLAKHYQATTERIIKLGNKLIWTALYLLQLQGWIRIDFQRPRVRIIRIPCSA